MKNRGTANEMGWRTLPVRTETEDVALGTHYSLWQQLANDGVADKKAVGWNAEAAVT